ncbi:MAG: hypothetical protein ACYDEY_07775 [Acidimicrobiales bacterium]
MRHTADPSRISYSARPASRRPVAPSIRPADRGPAVRRGPAHVYGSSFTGDAAGQLRALADDYDKRLAQARP